MPRRFVPAHLRKHGPGTAGRNKVRDAKICAEYARGDLSFEALGERHKMSRERARQIVRRTERVSERNKVLRAKWSGVFESSR